MHTEAWKGTFQEGLEKSESGSLVPEVSVGYEKAFRRRPSSGESDSWKNSIPPLLQALDGGLSDDCGLIIEYALPFNGQRIDAVLVGLTNDDTPSVMAVEMKHWGSSEVEPRLRHFVRVAGHPALHPSCQVLNYGGKLKFFHSVAQDWSVHQLGFISDGSPGRHAGVLEQRFDGFIKEAPLFFPSQGAELQDFIRDHLPAAPKWDYVKEYNEGIYSQSVKFLEGLQKHQESFFQRAEHVLAYNGWGLSEDQLLVHDMILSAMEDLPSNEPKAFLVSGGPGSGKSLLAHRLLFDAASLKLKPVFGLRNNRLMWALRKIIDPKYEGLKGALKYFSTPQGGKHGVEDSDAHLSDVLICDEAQRLKLATCNVFQRAPLTVCIYDESQILNMEESGTKNRMEQCCEELGIEPVHLTLPTLHRCRGGQAYLDWVERLLSRPEDAVSGEEEWKDVYDFFTVSSPDELRQGLRKRRNGSYKVGLLASFTRSSGYAKARDQNDLGKMRVPEASPKIEWLMDPQKEYVPFWVNGESSKLEKCSSIYGCQGFELDYAGIVWGDDMVIRDGQWRIGDSDNCYDRAPGSKPLKKIMKEEPEEALRLLRNRYRIMLTRGILGTGIHFEDDETRDFFD